MQRFKTVEGELSLEGYAKLYGGCAFSLSLSYLLLFNYFTTDDYAFYVLYACAWVLFFTGLYLFKTKSKIFSLSSEQLFNLFAALLLSGAFVSVVSMQVIGILGWYCYNHIFDVEVRLNTGNYIISEFVTQGIHKLYLFVVDIMLNFFGLSTDGHLFKNNI